MGMIRARSLKMGIGACSLVALLVLSGCGQTTNSKRDNFFKQWRVKAEQSTGHSPSATRRQTGVQSKGEQPPGSPQTPAAVSRALPTEKVSLNMNGIDLPVLLRALARAANQNIIINQTVQGKVNISVKAAPWDQVFLGILRTHGLSYEYEGDILRVLTIEDLDQDIKRQTQKRDQREVAPLVTQVVRVDYADAKDLQANLEAFRTTGRDGQPIGSVMVDSHTNSLIIQALAEDVQKMLPLVGELDRPTAQVLIEAHIVEATRETARNLGIQWGGQYTTGSGNTNSTIGAGTASSTTNTINIPTNSYGFNFPAAVGGGPGMAIGLLVSDILGGDLLAIQLSALETDRKLNILSSPSITTLDNQKATFESGREVPYQSVEDGNVKIEFKKAVLLLEVTPHVIDGNALKLKIRTTKDEVDSTVTSNPPIITKKAETSVILYDGQTTVIGGLNQESSTNTESGVPYLNKIPLLGALFRGTGDSTSMDEVLIFITPYILKERIGSPEPAAPLTPQGFGQ